MKLAALVELFPSIIQLRAVAWTNIMKLAALVALFPFKFNSVQYRKLNYVFKGAGESEVDINFFCLFSE